MRTKAISKRRVNGNTQIDRASFQDLDAASRGCVMQMLHGENDHFWHHRIKSLFAEAGIATRRIERMEEHPIWRAWLTRRSFALSGADQKERELLDQNEDSTLVPKRKTSVVLAAASLTTYTPA